MSAVGLVPHAAWLAGMLALLLAAIVVGPRVACAGETSMVGREPTSKEWAEARANAIKHLARKGAADIVDDAVLKVLQRFRAEGGDFSAMVLEAATRGAKVCGREAKAERRAAKTIRHFAPKPTDPDPPTPEEIDARRQALQEALDTPEATRDATLRECKMRFLSTVGESGKARLDGPSLPHSSVLVFRDLARNAARILAAARTNRHLLALVNVDGLEGLASLDVDHEIRRGVRTHRYTDAKGREKVYGSTYVESAVLAILDDSWPKYEAGETPKIVIDRKAEAIAAATERFDAISANRD